VIVSCPGCDAEYEVGEQPVGTRGRCRCGILFRIDRPPARVREATPSGRGCPRCSAQLWTRGIADVSIDDCPACGGCFVGRDTLALVIEGGPHHRMIALREVYPVGVDELMIGPPPGGAMYIKCPGCATRMNRERFLRDPRLTVDACRDHGTWFDARRFARALQIVEDGGLERSMVRAADAKRAMDDAIEGQRAAMRERDDRFYAQMKAGFDTARKAARWGRRLGKLV